MTPIVLRRKLFNSPLCIADTASAIRKELINRIKAVSIKEILNDKINYGFNKVRFIHPVEVDSNIRGNFILKNTEKKNQDSYKLTPQSPEPGTEWRDKKNINKSNKPLVDGVSPPKMPKKKKDDE